MSNLRRIGFILLLLSVVIYPYNQRNYFTVDGNSMYPTLRDGDIVEVTDPTYQEGDVVVAEVDGKKVVKRLEGGSLVGDNTGRSQNYPLQSVDSILGKAELRTNNLTAEERAEFEKVFAVGIKSIIAGNFNFVFAIRTDGKVFAWGENSRGQLGTGDTMSRDSPVEITALGTTTSSISVGSYHALAIKDGALYAWGQGSNGQLGNGTTTDKSTPTLVTGFESGVTMIAAGKSFSLAVKGADVYSWGYNFDGQLGLGDTTSRSTPTVISGFSAVGITSLVATIDCAAVVRNGALYTWGSNSSGQLGHGDFLRKKSPTLVPSLTSGVSLIAATNTHMLAVHNGVLKAWGSGGAGQLGNNSTTNSTTPVVTSGSLSNIVKLEVGNWASYALLSDGSVYSWGNNSYGHLGNGTTNSSSVPVKIISSGVTDIETALNAGFAIVGNYVMSWGTNGNNYVLGIASTTSSTMYTSPTYVKYRTCSRFYLDAQHSDTLTLSSTSNVTYPKGAQTLVRTATVAPADSIDTTATWTSDSPWVTFPNLGTVYSSPSGSAVSISVASNSGSQRVATVTVSLTDSSCGIASRTFTITQDGNSAPTITLSSNTNQTIDLAGTVTLSGNASDTNGDTLTISATLDGVSKSTTVPGGSGAWTLSWTGAELGEGTYATSVTISANDGVGGLSSTVYSGTVIVDNTPPTSPTITLSNASWSATPVTVTLSGGTDSGSGIQKLQYKIGAAMWSDYSAPFSISTSGTTPVYARAVDNVNLVSPNVVSNVLIDSSAPVLTSSMKTKEVISENGFVRLDFSATDANGTPTLSYETLLNGVTPLVGTASYKLSDSGAVNGRKIFFSSQADASLVDGALVTLRLRATDAAGNSSTRDIKIKIDNSGTFDINSM